MAKRRVSDAATGARKRTPMSTRPWYFDAAAKFGLPAVAAGFLLWFLTFVVDKKLDAIAKAQVTQQDLQVQTSEKLTSVVSLLSQQLDQAWIQVGIIQRTCLNTSKTDADRIACAALTMRPNR